MRRSLSVVLLLFLLVTPPALALTDEEIFREFRFNLINPGARAMAVGGAFVSLADDATAAQANPAGLAFLKKMEYFVELRAIDSAAESSVRSETLPTGIETFVATGTDVEDVVSPSFLSVVTAYGKWTMGLSLQDVLNINNTTVSASAFTFPGTPGAFLSAGQGRVQVDVRNFNVSVGAKIIDRLSVGATLTYSTLEADSEVFNRFVDTNGVVAGQAYLEETADLRTTIDDSDSDVVFSLGLVYKDIGKWGIGAVYRKAPRFQVTQRVEPLLADMDGDGKADDLFDVGKRFPGGQFVNQFHLPDSYGIGANWLPIKERLTLALDLERVLYSNLLDGYVPGVNILTDANAQFEIEDATNVRVGAEYVFFNERNFLPPLGLRGGGFTESDARITATSTGDDVFATPEVFAGRGRINHLTLGVGFVFTQIKLDVAADISNVDNQYVVSLIYRGK